MPDTHRESETWKLGLPKRLFAQSLRSTEDGLTYSQSRIIMPEDDKSDAETGGEEEAAAAAGASSALPVFSQYQGGV